MRAYFQTCMRLKKTKTLFEDFMNNLVVTPKRFLSELLPYDTSTKMNGSLRTSLKEYSLLLEAMGQAITALQSSRFEQFDAVVGENACQIRAVKIAMTTQKCFESVKSIQAQITNSKLKIETLSTSLEPLMRRGTSLQSLLEQEEEMDVALTSDELFLFESFLLSVAKIVKPAKVSSPLCRNDAADPKKLKQFGADISTSFTENLLRKVRQLLSAASVAFVQEQAKFLKDEQLEKMCSEDFIVTYNSWPCIPMFWTYKTLLLAAQKKGIPLVIYAKFLAKDKEYGIVDEDCIVFQPTVGNQGSFYEESVPYPSDLAKAAIFVQGVVCANTDLLPSNSQWRKTITTQKLDVILAGAADHRQYPNPEGDRLIKELNDGELERYKKMSRSEGYALENPSMFFIQHVYPATIGSMPQLIQKAKLLAEKVICSFLPERSIPEWPERAVTQIMYYLEDEGKI